MKRTIAFCILAVMLMSFTSCKREESDDDVAVVDKQNETVQTPADDTGKTQPTTDNTQKEDTPAVEQDKVETKPSEEQETTVQKGEPCKLTINNTFSDYIVVATLTDAESAKNKTYTPSDFPDLDVFLVFENNDYYNIKYYPEYETKTTLFLMLNTPSKQTVLDYIKLLEKDDRVYSAYGFAINGYGTFDWDFYFKVIFKDEKPYTSSDFPELPLRYITADRKSGKFYLDIDHSYETGVENQYVDNLKKALEDPRIESVIPCCFANSIVEGGIIVINIDLEDALLKNEYTAEDFPGLDIERIDCSDLKEAEKEKEKPLPRGVYSMTLYLNKPSKQNLVYGVDYIRNTLSITVCCIYKEGARYNGTVIDT